MDAAIETEVPREELEVVHVEVRDYALAPSERIRAHRDAPLRIGGPA